MQYGYLLRHFIYKFYFQRNIKHFIKSFFKIFLQYKYIKYFLYKIMGNKCLMFITILILSIQVYVKTNNIFYFGNLKRRKTIDDSSLVNIAIGH